jgi:hypothetical protein
MLRFPSEMLQASRGCDASARNLGTPYQGHGFSARPSFAVTFTCSVAFLCPVQVSCPARVGRCTCAHEAVGEPEISYGNVTADLVRDWRYEEGCATTISSGALGPCPPANEHSPVPMAAGASWLSPNDLSPKIPLPQNLTVPRLREKRRRDIAALYETATSADGTAFEVAAKVAAEAARKAVEGGQGGAK